MTIEYKIIETGDAENLTLLVNKSITEGWLPQGGVSVGPIGAGISQITIYVQAMIRKSP